MGATKLEPAPVISAAKAPVAKTATAAMPSNDTAMGLKCLMMSSFLCAPEEREGSGPACAGAAGLPLEISEQADLAIVSRGRAADGAVAGRNRAIAGAVMLVGKGKIHDLGRAPADAECVVVFGLQRSGLGVGIDRIIAAEHRPFRREGVGAETGNAMRGVAGAGRGHQAGAIVVGVEILHAQADAIGDIGAQHVETFGGVVGDGVVVLSELAAVTAYRQVE